MQPLVSYDQAPFNGPFAGRSTLIDTLGTLPTGGFEGLWTPTRFAKLATLMLLGTFATLSCQLYGTNADTPLNTQTITIGGSKTTGDVVTTTISGTGMNPGSVAVPYTVLSGDTLGTITAGIAAALAANTELQGAGFTFAVSGDVITVQYPSGVLNSANFGSPSNPAAANFVNIATSLSGGATETATVALGTDGQALGSAITALGLTAISPIPRWAKLRVTTLTGGNVSAYLAQTA